MDNQDLMLRHQEHFRQQRSAVNSHFLAYSGVLLALITHILIAEETMRVDWPGYFAGAGISALISLMAGCIATLARLHDGRLTARITRFQVENKSETSINAFRCTRKTLGKCSNLLIPFQVITFAIATLLFLTWATLSFWIKLSIVAH